MPGVTWIALSYRLPRQPSRLRLGVWRRLKRLGAVVLHDAVWLLPADPRTREAFEWLADEIEEQGGSAFIWEAVSLGAAQDRAIVARFRTEADERYGALAATARALQRLGAKRRAGRGGRVEQAGRQLTGLERALRLEARRDHFRAQGRRDVEAALREASEALGDARREQARGHAVGD